MDNKPDNYRLSFYYADQLVSERIFDANCYNPSVKYQVNLRPLTKEMVEDFRNALRQYVTVEDTTFDMGYERIPAMVSENPVNGENFLVPTRQGKPYNPVDLNQHEYAFNPGNGHDGEFSLVLYINETIILNRPFKMRYYNPDTLISRIFTDLIDAWVGYIQDDLRQRDIEQLWDETLLLKHGMFRSLKDVHAVDVEERSEMAKDLV